MQARHEARRSDNGPSQRECIDALRNNGHHFEHTADFPQNGIRQRFGGAFELATVFSESEVRRCFDAANEFVWDSSRERDDEEQRTGDSAALRNLQEAVLRYASLFKASQDIAKARSPTIQSLEVYREIIAQKSRAANGESILLYGMKGEPVPPYLTTIYDDREDSDDLIEKFIIDWLLDPFLELIINPFRSILPMLPVIGKRFEGIDSEQKLVAASITSALAKAITVMVAILCLTTAIVVLNEMKDSRKRILVAAVFAQLFALPIQFLSPRALPLYMLIIAYFQVMIFFVGTTSEQSRCQ